MNINKKGAGSVAINDEKENKVVRRQVDMEEDDPDENPVEAEAIKKIIAYLK